MLELFERLGIALFIGALVGTERGRRGEGADPLLGVRTFVILAELGAVSAWLSQLQQAALIFSVALAGVSVLVLGAYAVGVTRRGDLGLTTEVAALAVFLLGGAVVLTEPQIPVALAIVTALVLAMKDPLHTGVRRLSQDDVMAGLKLLFASFIVLPVLPREAVDPWGALRPYSLWLLVILIASISLVGYVGVRLLGQNRGLALTGLFGGLVSSTAVSLSFARRSREAPALSGALAAGVLIAWLTMAGRVLVEVAVVERSLLAPLAAPMLGFALPSALAAAIAWRGAGERGAGAGEELSLKNPFSLLGAIKVGALFAAVLVAVKLAQATLPAAGVYAVAALAGLTDVDAITLSLAQEVQRGELAAGTAVRGVLIAAVCNTGVKAGVVAALGSRRMAAIIGLGTAGTVIGVGAAILIGGCA